MECHASDRAPLYCILPPHLLHEIALRGTPAHRAFALNTLAADATIRFGRATYQLMATGAQKLMTPAPAVVEPHITIYDAHHGNRLPGAVVAHPRRTKDRAVTEAYAGLLATFTLYWEQFQRNSIDDHGLPLRGSVHYRRGYDNAFWNGQQMVFGDGDGEIFQRFTIAIDIMGHELTHGVTGDTANLIYQGQPGALNESISDVFGAMVKQYSAHPKHTTAQADWLIGAGIFMPAIHGEALRSMKAPGTAYDDPMLGKDPQPATMQDYVDTDEDNGGVHINSGIPNRAFYLAAQGFGGYAWDTAGKIWYATLRDPALRPSATFVDFANVTIAHAGTLFDATGRKVVTDAWQTVGVL
jgi:Zn-dependent metalloprotease